MLDHCGEVHGQQLEAPAARQLVLPCFVRVELDNPIEERQHVHVPSGSHAHAGASFGIGPPSQSSHDSCTHTFRAPLPLPAPFSGATTVTSTCGM